MMSTVDFAIKTGKVADSVHTQVLRYFPNQPWFTLYNPWERKNIAQLPKIRLHIDFGKAERSTNANEVGPKARGPGVLEFSKIRLPMIVGRNPDHENLGNIGFIVDVASPYPMPVTGNALMPHLFVNALPNMRLAFDRAYQKYIEHRANAGGKIPVYDVKEWNHNFVPTFTLVGFVSELADPLERVRLLRN